MSKEKIAKECGYEKVKGFVTEEIGAFVKEDELKEYWYEDETELYFPDTEKGLNELCDFEEKVAKERERKSV